MGFEDYRHPFDNCDSGDDFFLFFYFLMNKRIMATPSVMLKDVKDT